MMRPNCANTGDGSQAVDAPAGQDRVKRTGPAERSRTGETASAWRSPLTIITCGTLLFLTLTGLSIYLLPFSVFNQVSILTHTILGAVMTIPMLWYLWRHWQHRRKGNFNHYQLIGYLAAALFAVCLISGFVVTWQGAFGPRMTEGWQQIHLVTGIALPIVLVVHLVTVVVRKVNNVETKRVLLRARRVFYAGSAVTCGLMFGVTLLWAHSYEELPLRHGFPDDYNWRFGMDRPYAPSLARTDQRAWQQSVEDRVLGILEPAQRPVYLAAFREVENEHIGLFAQIQHGLARVSLTDEQHAAIDGVLDDAADWIANHGAIDARHLTGSARCGTCHEQVYQEWLPSAHRYAAMDDLFQVVQEVMAYETSPEHTRYCAGCHDPVSLFSGAKTTANITLSAEGYHEGISCVVCHSIVQADVQGNADFTLRPARRYMYELDDGRLARFFSDFLIRTYPDHHVESFSRPLYRTAEYCGACHKQFMDTDLNTDIGRVQGQNQYDSWLHSRWHVPGDPHQTVDCRECHMPLKPSTDPAAGDAHDYYRSADDGMHRSHRFLGGNQYVPILHRLEGAEEHVRLTEKWLRGEYEIPEIAHKWTTGPVVRMRLNAPEDVPRGDPVPFQVVLTNNKTGHDFPTGPLDMIESWVEVIVTNEQGEVAYHSGGLDERDAVVDTLVWFAAEGFDREGELMDRHNLWDMVGKSYSRSLYPGMTDTVEVQLQCPSMARGRLASPEDAGRSPGQRVDEFTIPASEKLVGELHLEAILWYRKANPDFLDRMYGVEAEMRSPVTEMNRVSTKIRVIDDDEPPARME